MLVRGNPKVVPAELYTVTDELVSAVLRQMQAWCPGRELPSRSDTRLRLEDQRFYAAIWDKPLGSHVPSD
jgi:hypothetical protein